MDFWRIVLEIVGIRGHYSPTFRTLFLMLGKAAKIGEDEDDYTYLAGIVLKGTNLPINNSSVKRIATEYFKEGLVTETPFAEIAAEFAHQVEDINTRREALYLLVRAAATSNEHYLFKAANKFGLSLDELKEAMISQATFMMFGRMTWIRTFFGGLDRQEVSVVEAFMDADELDGQARRRATEFFYESVATAEYWPPSMFGGLAGRYVRYEENIDKRRCTLYRLVRIATATGKLDEGAERDLHEAVSVFGLSQDELHYELFLAMAFLLIGKIAKADSIVSENEIDAIEACMNTFDPETRQRAIDFFNQGKTMQRSCKEIAKVLAKYIDAERRINILFSFVRIASADGELHGPAKHYLCQVAEAFGYSQEILDDMYKEILAERQHVEECYAILECDPSVSDAELNKSYRNLSRQYHPDVISSKKLAPDFIKFANEKFQEIQNAYETVTKHRKQ